MKNRFETEHRLPCHCFPRVCAFIVAAILIVGRETPAPAQLLDKQKLLDAQTFWDNRDWDWYKEHVPFFECPDADINTTYYYRWELVTKHLTYGSPNSGYSFTEFIDRPFWSGAYGSISCPAGHQLYEVRWLRDKRYAQDYSRYWFNTRAAEPRRYSTWLADAVWAVHLVQNDDEFVKNLLPDLVKNYEDWEREHFVPEVGLFWQTGHDDGMEININSRQTKDTVRGAPGYRPTLNSYLWADARAIARCARLAGKEELARQYTAKAASLKEHVEKTLWDDGREFFLQVYKQDEARDGHTIRALTKTYETGQFAGSKHGREEIGFVPWQFNLPDSGRGYEVAWKFLTDRDYFFSDFGPTTVERHDPMFALSKSCCWWSGQSWPYATTQTLVALANLLNNYAQKVLTKDDYIRLLRTYARTHRKNGKPYIAEACHPDTGSWEGHDSYNHSEHYFHSGFCDLVITGLVGLRPRDDNTIEVNPLAPDDWNYFVVDGVWYRGREVSIVWDKDGSRYNLGAGLHIVVDGKKLASSPKLTRLTAQLPKLSEGCLAAPPVFNFAVNNDGTFYPRVTASHSGERSSLMAAHDGNYWYHIDPPNRWTCEGSGNSSDWLALEFGIERDVHEVALYVLDDGEKIKPPAKIELEYWDGQMWLSVPHQLRTPQEPTGRRANRIRFNPVATTKLRVTLTHESGAASGLSEIEAWGTSPQPVPAAPEPPPSLATNRSGTGYPKASASHTSRFDKVEMANDGKVNFSPTPHNRWTSYESPNASDWLEIDFDEERDIGRIELAIYDDRGGVQAPTSYNVQFWDGSNWRDAADQKKSPEQPAGGQFNEVRFNKVTATKVRVVFIHRGKSRSGVSEVFVWAD